MKNNRYFKMIRVIILISSFIPMFISLYSLVSDKSVFGFEKNEIENWLYYYEGIVIILCFMDILIPNIIDLFKIKTTNKKEIYISYSKRDAVIQKNIISALEKDLKKEYKIYYKDMKETKNNKEGEKSLPESYIIIVSSNYVNDLECVNECKKIINSKKKYYPVVINSYKELNKLPDDVSSVKSAFVKENSNPNELKSEIKSIANKIQQSSYSNSIPITC